MPGEKKKSVFSSRHSHWEHDLKATTAACPSPAHHWACQHWIMDWRYILSPCASCWANSHWWIWRQEGSLSSVESIIVSPPPPVDSSKPIITQTTPGKISVCVGVGEVICIRKQLGMAWEGYTGEWSKNTCAHTFLLVLGFGKAFIYKVCSASVPLRTEEIVKILNSSGNRDSVWNIFLKTDRIILGLLQK